MYCSFYIKSRLLTLMWLYSTSTEKGIYHSISTSNYLPNFVARQSRTPQSCSHTAKHNQFHTIQNGVSVIFNWFMYIISLLDRLVFRSS
jgi:hypothetical protein